MTFVVMNVGGMEHESVLGDRAYQEMHEQEMSEGGHAMDDDNA